MPCLEGVDLGIMLSHLGRFIDMMQRRLGRGVRVLKQSCRMNTSRFISQRFSDCSP
jgi:hypothetical protein